MATVVALSSFVGRLRKDTKDKPGEKVEVVKGQMFDSNHPAVKAFPTMFGLPENVTRSVESATAAPGEKRA